MPLAVPMVGELLVVPSSPVLAELAAVLLVAIRQLEAFATRFYAALIIRLEVLGFRL
jgi:hypothetical protein